MQLCHGGILPTDANVRLQGVIEQVHVLEHHGQAGHELFRGLLPHIHATNFDRTGSHIVKPANQPGDGGFAAAGGANQGHHGFRRHRKRDVPQHRGAILVGERHMIQTDGARGRFRRGRVRLRQRLGSDDLVDGVKHRAAILQGGGGVGDAGQHLGVPEAQADKRNGLHRL